VINLIFGDILKELRLDAGLTQEDLALKLNITRAVLSKYELNINEPSLEFLSIVSDFFNVSVDYLLLLFTATNLVIKNI
jgi:transcriptional regulator with XRE-family HTH domain